MGFQHGVGGVMAASKQLDVIGNNVANSNTVGFKGSRAEFADMFAANFYGVGATQAGLGTRVAAVAQQFNQGNITSTGNQLDLAISGNGMFAMKNPQGTSYTRNGQFQVDKDGYIINGADQLLGYPYNETAAKIDEGLLQPLRIDNSQLSPRSSDTAPITWQFNIDSRSSAPTVAPFDPTNINTYNATSSTKVYDTLGNPYDLNIYYIKGAAAGSWTAEFRIPITDNSVTPPTTTYENLGSQAVTFDTAGKISSPTTKFALTPFDPNTQAIPPMNAAVLNMEVDLTGTTQFGNPFEVNSVSQPGYASSVLTRLNIDKYGTIFGSFSNGQSKTLGQVALTTFANPQGLQQIGNNRWIETLASGNAVHKKAGDSSVGVIQAQAVEDANVDLTQELVNMIQAQRFYQANTQTIKVQDAVMQSLINLR